MPGAGDGNATCLYSPAGPQAAGRQPITVTSLVVLELERVSRLTGSECSLTMTA